MEFMPSRRRGELPARKSPRSGNVWERFDDFFNSRFADLPVTSEMESFSPEINVKETDDSYIVEAELAGMKRDEIDIEIRGDRLVLKGDKRSFNEDQKDNYYHMERRYGSFYRAIPLDVDVDEAKCDATFQDGLLTITLPKKEEQKSKSKKIKIQ